MAENGRRGERFELERFEWKAPDRLEVAGKMHGLDEAKLDEPVLVVSGADGARRLRAAPGDPSGDGGSWRAEFVWDDAPVGVEAATLELGRDISVDLPAPGTKETLLRPQFLDVHRAAGPEPAAAGPEPAAPAPAGDIGLQAELLAAEQEVQEVRAALERAEGELTRARADVEAERQGRAADAERFREGLARVRASAEHALDAARGDTQAQLSEAREKADAELAELRDRSEAAETERDALREEVAAGEQLRRRVDALEQAGGEAGEMRADAERLLERLTKFVDALHPEK